jgi:hypothetical protein
LASEEGDLIDFGERLSGCAMVNQSLGHSPLNHRALNDVARVTRLDRLVEDGWLALTIDDHDRATGAEARATNQTHLRVWQSACRDLALQGREDRLATARTATRIAAYTHHSRRLRLFL